MKTIHNLYKLIFKRFSLQSYLLKSMQEEYGKLEKYIKSLKKDLNNRVVFVIELVIVSLISLFFFITLILTFFDNPLETYLQQRGPIFGKLRHVLFVICIFSGSFIIWNLSQRYSGLSLKGNSTRPGNFNNKHKPEAELMQGLNAVSEPALKSKHDKTKSKHDKTLILIIIFVTAILRIVWISLSEVLPKSDFATYHNLADGLAHGVVKFNDYIAVFPHVIGYPLILAVFYNIFGTEVLVAQLLNIAACCGISLVIYKLGKTLLDSRCGLIAAGIWALWPSQIFYTSLVSTEAIFTLLNLSCILFLFKIINRKRTHYLPTFILFSSAGLFLAFINQIRPLSLVLITAFAIYYFLLSTDDPPKIGNKFITKIAYFLILIFTYFLFTRFFAFVISDVIDKKVADSPFGFNLYIGVNTSSRGTWNITDSQKLGDMMKNPEFSAQEIQNNFKDMAISRIKENSLNNIQLLFDKHRALWSMDSESLTYIMGALTPDKTTILKSEIVIKGLTIISNLYYYIILLLCCISSVTMLKRIWINKKAGSRHNTGKLSEMVSMLKSDMIIDMKPDANMSSITNMSMLVLFVLGVAALHMVFEVVERYHYPVIAVFSIIAAYRLAARRSKPLKHFPS